MQTRKILIYSIRFKLVKVYGKNNDEVKDLIKILSQKDIVTKKVEEGMDEKRDAMKTFAQHNKDRDDDGDS